MNQNEFRKQIDCLFPQIPSCTTNVWIQYAEELAADGTETMDQYLHDLFHEYQAAAKTHGTEIARTLYTIADLPFTLNPFEVKEAANLLANGKTLEEISVIAVEGDMFSFSGENEEQIQSI